MPPVLPLAVLLTLHAAAPAAALVGRVLELGSADGVPGAFISAAGLSRAARSGADGRYRLDLPEGYAALTVAADGFDPRALRLTVTAASAALPDAWLRRRALEMAPVRVRARREEAPSRTPIKREEIRRIAGIGRDPLRALQTLPGVTAPSDFSGLLAVRGGGPSDNAYFLNEIPYPVPFHYGGAISTVHTDLLSGVDLYAAAFPARWGGVDGAILDAHSRPIKRDRLHGQTDVNLLLAEALFEGPLGWRAAPAEPVPVSGSAAAVSGTAAALSPTVAAGLAAAAQAVAALDAPRPQARGAWLLSGRRSYFELLLSQLGDRFTAVPRFWDGGLMGELDLGPRDSLRLTALATDDVMGLELKADDVRSQDFTGEFRFHNWFESGGLNWIHRADWGRNVLTPYVYSNGSEQSIGSRKYFISIHPTVYGLKDDVTLQRGAHEVSLGGAYSRTNFDVFGYIFRRRSGGGSGVVTLSDPAGITVSAYTSEGSAYLQDRVRLAESLRATAGLRWQKAERMGKEGWDPRLALEWQPGPATRVSAGWGLFSQYPSPQQLSDDFGNPALDFEHAEHVVAGVEQGVAEGTLLKAEAYYKTLRTLVVDAPDARIYSNDGEGFARGVEFMLKRYGDGRWFGWISYSLSESWRLQRGGGWQRYAYDQPQNMTVLGSYNFSPAWSSGARLNWHSGPLITPVVGTVPDSDPANTSGVQPVYSSSPYSERLEDYLRLDLRTDYAFRFRGWKLNLYAEVINVLGRNNPSGVTYNKDYSQRETVNNLPRLPYIGVGAEF